MLLLSFFPVHRSLDSLATIKSRYLDAERNEEKSGKYGRDAKHSAHFSAVEFSSERIGSSASNQVNFLQIFVVYFTFRSKNSKFRESNGRR